MKKEEIIENIFGSEASIVSPLVGGMMNESYIISSHNVKYVLYIATEQANEMVDRVLEKEHLDIAYGLGITKQNVYMDVKTGIKANYFIDGNSLDRIDSFDYQKVADVLHKLHASKKLSKQDYLPFERFKGYESESNSFREETNEDYKVIRSELMQNKEYLEKQTKVFSHNDAQRSNFVKGDDGEYYLIDYEFAGNNDEIYDIACFGNGDVKEGYKLLEAYFKNPNVDQKKRYYLWRMYVSLQWYNVAIVKHFRGEGKIHGFDFMKVAEHFLENAKEAYSSYKNVISE